MAQRLGLFLSLAVLCAATAGYLGCGKDDGGGSGSGSSASSANPTKEDIQKVDCDKVAAQTIECMKKMGVKREIDAEEKANYKKSCVVFKDMFKPEDETSMRYAKQYIAYGNGECP